METYTYTFGGKSVSILAWSHIHGGDLACQELGMNEPGCWALFPGNRCVWQYSSPSP